MHDQGCEQHRQHQRRHRYLHDGRRQQIQPVDERNQHEAELSASTEPQTRAHSRAGRRPERARCCRDHRELEHQQGKQHPEHRGEVHHNRADIEEHADRYEEQAKQHVAKGLDILLDLISILGFRNQHASQEGAQRHGEPDRLRQPGKAQGNQQDIEHEEFTGTPARHQRKPGPHPPLSEYKHHRKQDDRLHPRNTQCCCKLTCRP